MVEPGHENPGHECQLSSQRALLADFVRSQRALFHAIFAQHWKRIMICFLFLLGPDETGARLSFLRFAYVTPSPGSVYSSGLISPTES